MEYLSQFQKGEVDAFYQSVSEAFASQLPKEQFLSQWSSVIQMAGKQESVGEPVVETRNGQTAVTITSVYTLRRVENTFVYDDKGTVIGVYSRFLPLITSPQTTDEWEELPIQVGSGENKLNGLLTLPKGVKQPPVAILLQGSGPSNMDEKIGGGNVPFADLAHGLATRGVASIRYDKRTYAYPADCVGKGIECEYLNDAASAIALATSDGRVDASRIVLVGHSEGGMVAPKIAYDHKEVKGLVSMAGSLRRLEDISLDQTRKMVKQDTMMTDEQKQAYLQQMESEVQRVKKLDKADTTSVIMGIDAVYWNSLNAIDGPAIVRDLEIPMLILQGEEDFQVTVEQDFQLWKDTLSGRDDVTFHLYPELNHLFSVGGSKDYIDVTVYDTVKPMDAQVIADIADWISSIGK